LAQLYLLGKKNRIGFISGIIAGTCWISYSLISQSAYGLIIVCGLGLFLNTKGFINWTKNKTL
jgi:hypothetical protein